jgi:hypothetical protein
MLFGMWVSNCMVPHSKYYSLNIYQEQNLKFHIQVSHNEQSRNLVCVPTESHRCMSVLPA